MMLCITDQDVIDVSNKKRKFVRQKHCGKKQDTRKNPHAIAVGLDLNWPVKLWYITWMAT
jgi:hypothetical protein